MMRFVSKSLTGLSVAIMVFAVGGAAWADGNWPAFRGADARGIADGAGLPVEWSATQNVEWKTDIPGRGWSSPVVWGDKVFLTTVINLGETPQIKKGLYFGGDLGTPETVHQWKVLCLSLTTGEVLWQKQVYEGKPETGIHLKNSFASETPVTDGERLYVYFGNVGVFAFDLNGETMWERRIEASPMRYNWGTAASPALHGDRLYIVNDNDADSYLLALDKKSGDIVWRTERDEGSNWATPYVWEHESRTEIVTPGTGLVRSYDLDGELVWTLSGMSSITIATPYEDGGLLYVTSGYVGDRQYRPVYAIRPGAEGNIALAEGETSNDSIAWSWPLAGPYNPSTIVYDGQLYVLYDRGRMASFNSGNGEVVYEDARFPRGSKFTTSPWAYDGKIFCLDEDGVTHVVEAGKTFNIVQTNRLAGEDMGMSTPALAGDRLLIRTAVRVYSIRNH